VRLSNVATGTEDTDAVNVQQLNKATSDLNGKLSDVTNRFDQKLNEATNRLERRVNDMEDDANSGIAAAMAVATRGETGYAVGVSTVSEEGSWLFKANGAVSSKGHGGGGVSATYLWH
jgi:autotransporter adhesin